MSGHYCHRPSLKRQIQFWHDCEPQAPRHNLFPGAPLMLFKVRRKSDDRRHMIQACILPNTFHLTSFDNCSPRDTCDIPPLTLIASGNHMIQARLGHANPSKQGVPHTASLEIIPQTRDRFHWIPTLSDGPSGIESKLWTGAITAPLNTSCHFHLVGTDLVHTLWFEQNLRSFFTNRQSNDQ